MATVIECNRIVQAAINRKPWQTQPMPPRFEAYQAAFDRALAQSGAPYSAATPRLICLASRIAGLLS
jgi:hypothetical protein